MPRSLRLTVLTPTARLVRSKAVDWVKADLADGGSIGIWPGHAPLVAETVDGPLRYGDESGERRLGLRAGVLHIDSAGVTVLVPGRVDQ